MVEVIMTGSGQWVGKNAQHIIDEGLTPRWVIGRRPRAEGQASLESFGFNGAQYISPEEFETLPLSKDTIGIVFSANENHNSDARALLSGGVNRVAVDKPFSPTHKEALALVDTFSRAGGIVFAQDHYLPKARSAEHVFGIKQQAQYMESAQEHGPAVGELFGAIQRIGAIHSVTANLVEAGGINGRVSLDKAKTGGVLLDLAVHLAAVASRLGFIRGVTVHDVMAQTFDPYSTKSSGWEPVKQFGKGDHAEMLSQVSMKNANGVDIHFTVGKIGSRTDFAVEKVFKVQGASGVATIDFNNARTDVELVSGERFGVKLMINPYRLIFKDIRAALEQNGETNVSEALEALLLIEEIKRAYRYEAEISAMRETPGAVGFQGPLPTAV